MTLSSLPHLLHDIQQHHQGIKTDGLVFSVALVDLTNAVAVMNRPL